MTKKTTAILLIVSLALILGVALRTANRADASAANCYSETKGPSEPTVCS